MISLRAKFNKLKKIDNQKYSLTFEVESNPELEYLNDTTVPLKLTISKLRKKRSLNANAYLWVLCEKIAKALQTSKDEVYEEMLNRYGTYDYDDIGYITIQIRNYVDIKRLGGHWQLLTQDDDWSGYIKIKGSSEYNTKEMSTLIDGVVYECKELGIETLPPHELEIMKQAWGNMPIK